MTKATDLCKSIEEIQEILSNVGVKLNAALAERDVMLAALEEVIEEWEDCAAYKHYLAFKDDDYGRAAKMRKQFGLPYLGNMPEEQERMNEYGRKLTCEEFKAVLLECPIQYFHSIGEIFS